MSTRVRAAYTAGVGGEGEAVDPTDASDVEVDGGQKEDTLMQAALLVLLEVALKEAHPSRVGSIAQLVGNANVLRRYCFAGPAPRSEELDDSQPTGLLKQVPVVAVQCLHTQESSRRTASSDARQQRACGCAQRRACQSCNCCEKHPAAAL